jgi:hypothetical protein
MLETAAGLSRRLADDNPDNSRLNDAPLFTVTIITVPPLVRVYRLSIQTLDLTQGDQKCFANLLLLWLLLLRSRHRLSHSGAVTSAAAVHTSVAATSLEDSDASCMAVTSTAAASATASTTTCRIRAIAPSSQTLDRVAHSFATDEVNTFRKKAAAGLRSVAALLILQTLAIPAVQ